jgi:predicted amidohydrolase
MSTVRVACHQLAPVVGDLDGNRAEVGGDGRLHNSAALVDASGVRAVYRKAHLWDRESLVFTPGDARPPVLDTPHGRIGLMVCSSTSPPRATRRSGRATTRWRIAAPRYTGSLAACLPRRPPSSR